MQADHYEAGTYFIEDKQFEAMNQAVQYLVVDCFMELTEATDYLTHLRSASGA